MRYITEEKYQELVEKMDFMNDKDKRDFAHGMALVLAALKSME